MGGIDPTNSFSLKSLWEQISKNILRRQYLLGQIMKTYMALRDEILTKQQVLALDQSPQEFSLLTCFLEATWSYSIVTANHHDDFFTVPLLNIRVKETKTTPLTVWQLVETQYCKVSPQWSDCMIYPFIGFYQWNDH